MGARKGSVRPSTAGCVRTINYSPEMVSVRTGLRAYRKSNTELACDPGHTRISNTLLALLDIRN